MKYSAVRALRKAQQAAPKHRVEVFRCGYYNSTTFGWQCLDCDDEQSGMWCPTEAKRAAALHGRVVAS